jgi:hypothetical protein
MSNENIFETLERLGLDCSGLNYSLYKEFSRTTKDENEIVKKIQEYNEYYKNNNNKYSDITMKYLRQRYGLSKYDFSEDEEINQLSPNEVFEHVVKWNGLLGSYSETIKDWVKEIYGVDLDEIGSGGNGQKNI